jgi:hypothetical protein
MLQHTCYAVSNVLTAPYLFGFMGNGITRCVAVALPCSTVRGLLPSGLELGNQELTPRGTHPVIFQFHRFSECQFSFPTLLHPMRFHEQTVGIPFTHVRGGNSRSENTGPYYFMPKLYLDDSWVLLNGTFWWGFNKQLAPIDVSEDRYTVRHWTGQSLATLSWSADEGADVRAVTECREFEPFREILNQTLVTLLPAAVGPLLTLTDFDRRWNLTSVRPLQSSLEIGASYMPGFEGGHFLHDQAGDACSSVLGSFELSGPWWLSLPYPGSGRPWYTYS